MLGSAVGVASSLFNSMGAILSFFAVVRDAPGPVGLQAKSLLALCYFCFPDGCSRAKAEAIAPAAAGSGARRTGWPPRGGAS